MVDVDCAGEGAGGELAAGHRGEHLAHGVHHRRPQLGRGQQVVHGLGAQGVEHPGEEEVRGVDDGEQEHQLEELTEEELGEVPVVLTQREHEAVHGVAPPVQLLVVLPDLVQGEAGHPAALQVVPHEGGHQERDGLEEIYRDYHQLNIILPCSPGGSERREPTGRKTCLGAGWCWRSTGG